MAIAAYPATVKIGANTVADIMTYEIPLKMDMAETTAFGGSGGAAVGTKTFIPTLFGTQIKASGSWNKADTNGQAALETAFFARTATTLIFSPNGTNTYSASCFISDLSIKADVKGKVDIDYTFQITGALTPA